MTRVERGEAEMTWDEIGQALGFTAGSQARKSAFMIYKNAMRKIRNRPASVKALRDLIAFRNAQRRAPIQLPDWDC